MGDDLIDVAKKAKPVVRSALEAMLRRARRARPFAVLEDVATGQFVQWCGSDGEPLKFDAPAAHIIVERAADVEKSVERGLEVLAMLAVRPDSAPFAEGLLLLETDTFDSDLLVRAEYTPAENAPGPEGEPS